MVTPIIIAQIITIPNTRNAFEAAPAPTPSQLVNISSAATAAGFCVYEKYFNIQR